MATSAITDQKTKRPRCSGVASYIKAVWDGFLLGGAEGIRTPDLLSAMLAEAVRTHTVGTERLCGTQLKRLKTPKAVRLLRS